MQCMIITAELKIEEPVKHSTIYDGQMVLWFSVAGPASGMVHVINHPFECLCQALYQGIHLRRLEKTFSPESYCCASNKIIRAEAGNGTRSTRARLSWRFL